MDEGKTVTGRLGTMAEPGRSRRSIVLPGAAWLGNLFLIAFAGDALVSVAELAVGSPDLRVLASDHPALYAARHYMGLIILTATVLMPFVLLFVPHLPKLPFLLPIGFIVLGGASAFQPALLPVSITWLDVVEPVVAGASFLLVRARTGGWLLSPAKLPRKRHLVVRTMFAMVVTIVVVPLTTLAMVVVALVATVERHSGGYLDVTASGIDVRESVLTKGNRTVSLMAMVHYGEEDFYRTLFDGIPSGSLVLAEGITDREKRLQAFPSALKIARMLGLTQQPDPRRALGAGQAVESRPPATPSSSHPDVILADVDMAEFSDATLAMLHDLAGVYDSDSIAEGVRRLLARKRTREEYAAFTHDLIDKRNAKLLAAFDDNAGAYASIVIPWGVLHMPGLQKGLEERGYRIDAQRQRTVVRFGIVDWRDRVGRLVDPIL